MNIPNDCWIFVSYILDRDISERYENRWDNKSHISIAYSKLGWQLGYLMIMQGVKYPMSHNIPNSFPW